MSWQACMQVAALVVALGVAVPMLGRYMALVYGSRDDGSALATRGAGGGT